MADKSEVTETDIIESPVESFFARNRPYLTAIAITLIFVMMTFAIYRLTSEVRYDDVIAALLGTSFSAVLLAIIFTALSFLALIFYDANAIEYVGKKVRFPSMAATAFAAYAIGNTAGFGPLSGGAIRFRAYSRLGLSPGDIARVIAFVTLSFGLGLLSVSALSTFIVAPRIAAIIGFDPLVLRAAHSPSSPFS